LIQDGESLARLDNLLVVLVIEQIQGFVVADPHLRGASLPPRFTPASRRPAPTASGSALRARAAPPLALRDPPHVPLRQKTVRGEKRIVPLDFPPKRSPHEPRESARPPDWHPPPCPPCP